MALDALIFDLDGTLVDTNALHIEAWVQAFAQNGFRIPADRIAREVGEGGDQLVPRIIGASADKEFGDALRKAQPKIFAELIEKKPPRVFHGAVDLLRAVKQRGLKMALASSSETKTIENIERAAKVDLQKLFDEVVTASDIEKTKPQPDIVLASHQKLKLSPAQCAMVGDTIYDAIACIHGGVASIGVTCGGVATRDELKSCGARVVYDDPQDMLNHLGEALSIVSPGPAHLTEEFLEKLMRQALDIAQEAMKHGEAPIAAILARGDGSIIASACNEQNHTQNKTAHAEIVAFARAAGKVPLGARDLILVSTLEPCVMCTGAAMVSAVDTIVYGLRAPADSGTSRVRPPQSPESQMPRFIGDVLASDSLDLFKQWLKQDLRDEQRKYAEQLVKLNEK
jgi:HAD superfamily hydrolase (TIGR01509 family)